MSNVHNVKALRLREGAEIPLKVIEKIVQTKRQAGRNDRYSDYNERWIDRPAWSEHIDRWTKK